MKALYALALVAGIAQAQSGVALTTPAATNAQAEAMKKEPGTAAVYPVKVNPSALESNVVTMEIEGKTYRFVGKKKSAQGTHWVNGKEQAQTGDTWTGSDGPSTATFFREGSSVYGRIDAEGEMFVLYNWGLVKVGYRDIPEGKR
jgi:hypothetical protein